MEEVFHPCDYSEINKVTHAKLYFRKHLLKKNAVFFIFQSISLCMCVCACVCILISAP